MTITHEVMQSDQRLVDNNPVLIVRTRQQLINDVGDVHVRIMCVLQQVFQMFSFRCQKLLCCCFANLHQNDRSTDVSVMDGIQLNNLGLSQLTPITNSKTFRAQYFSKINV